MEEALHEKEDLKLRVHKYISVVYRIEKLIAAKAREHCFMLYNRCYPPDTLGSES